MLKMRHALITTEPVMVTRLCESSRDVATSKYNKYQSTISVVIRFISRISKCLKFSIHKYINDINLNRCNRCRDIQQFNTKVCSFYLHFLYSDSSSSFQQLNIFLISSIKIASEIKNLFAIRINLFTIFRNLCI